MNSLLKRVYFNKNIVNDFVKCISQVHCDSKNNYNHDNFSEFNKKRAIIGTSLALVAYKLYDNYAYLQEKAKEENIGKYQKDLPTYTLKEVSEHSTKETGVWVSYKEGVYDITDFIEQHPGGEQILLAAGSSVEPFWLLYGVHKNPQVLDILESMRIGNLSKEDATEFLSNQSDPYAAEPKRHRALKPASEKPFNAEPPLSLLVENFLTPNELFYVRNHLPVPEVDANTYELELEVEGTKKLFKFNLEQLKKLPKHTITATIMCAGNRRSEMTTIKQVKGLNWGGAAVGNATWTGVRLRDILKAADIDENTSGMKHVHFEGLDLDTSGSSYAGSIPFWKAVDKRGDVILAYEMNGVPIPRDHGFPVRVVVPGIVGARNVKWLGRIVVSKHECNSHWQQNDYKGFSPSTDWDTVDFSKSPAIQELPVISAICQPSAGDVVKVENGHILIKGYAWSGGGQKIVRVDVTVDGGETWHPANFDCQDSTDPPQHWSWTIWSVKIPITKGTKNVEIWAKAIDSSYNTQPESFKNIWNLRGVLGNAYHRVPIYLK